MPNLLPFRIYPNGKLKGAMNSITCDQKPWFRKKFIIEWAYKKLFMRIFSIKRFITEYYVSSFLIKDCVRYIFANLFCMSKKEHLRKKDKCFLFHFENSFRSENNQIFTSQVFSRLYKLSERETWNCFTE